MDKESSHVRIAQESVRGSAFLFVGSFLQTVVSAIAIIIIARVLGPGPYGLYTLSFVIPGLLQLFLGLGVNSAVTRYAAYYVSIGRIDDAKRFTRNGVAFLCLFGLLLSLINFVVSAVLSAYVLKRPEMTQLVQLASLIILGQAILQSAYSALIGWNSMRLAGASYVLQGILRFGLSVGLVLTGFGVSGAIVGNVLSYLFAGLVFALALYLTKLRGPWGVNAFLNDVNEMIRYGVPAFAGLFLSGLGASYMMIIMASIASNAVIGFYQAAYNVTAPIGIVSGSIASALLPAFASLDGAKGDVSAALRHAVKYVSYLVTPMVVFLISAAAVFLDLLYGHSYFSGVIYLQLLSVSNIPFAIGLTVTPVFFNGLGKTRLTMISYTANAVCLVVLAPIMGVTLGFGVAGLIYALSVTNVVTAVAGLVLADRRIHVRIETVPLVGILVASLVAFAVTYPVNFLPIPDIASLLIQLVVYTIAYLTTAPLLRAVGLDDIARLETSIEGLGFLRDVIRPLFRYERFLVSSLNRRQSAAK